MKKTDLEINKGIGLIKVSCKKDADGNIPALPPEMMTEAKESFKVLVNASKKGMLDWYNIGRVIYYKKMTVKAQDFVKSCDADLKGLNPDQRGASWQVYDRWSDVWSWYNKENIQISNIRAVWTQFKKYESDLEADKMSDADKAEAEAEANQADADKKIKTLMDRAKNFFAEINETCGNLTLVELHALEVMMSLSNETVVSNVNHKTAETLKDHNITVKGLDKAA